MNDIDHDLREMFRRRDADLLGPVEAPPRIARRVRRRQIRTSAVAGATALAVAGAAFFGLRALTDHTGTHVPADTEGGVTTAYTQGVAIAYPSEWSLTVFTSPRGIDAEVALTNFELDPSNDDACAAMPAGGVLLLVLPDEVEPGPGQPATWPVDLQPSLAPDHCPRGVVPGAIWTTPVHRTFAAQAFVGPQASDADRARLLEAFASMTFQQYGDQVYGSGTVLASGTIGDRPWTLYARRGEQPSGPGLDLETSQSGGGLSGGGFGTLDVQAATDVALVPDVMHGNTFLYGGVTADVESVRVAPDGADAFDVPLYGLPSSLHTTIRVFVAPMLGAPTGSLTTYDASGAMLAEVRFAPGTACWAQNPCAGSVTPGGPIGEGTSSGTHWRIEDRDGAIQLLDDQDNVLGSVAGAPSPLLLKTATFGTGDRVFEVGFGIASADTTSVVLFTSGLPSNAATAKLPDGRVVFWASWSPPSEHGQILAFDSSCSLIGALDLATGQPSAQPALTDCQT